MKQHGESYQISLEGYNVCFWQWYYNQRNVNYIRVNKTSAQNSVAHILIGIVILRPIMNARGSKVYIFRMPTRTPNYLRKFKLHCL